jgi:hypothetical protein
LETAVKRNCLTCAAEFEIDDDEKSYLSRFVFQFGEYTSKFPPPVECPDCRLQIRTAHRNEQYMYHGKSAMSGKQMITLYAPTLPWGEAYKVYTQDEWHGDGWDAAEYGREFDFRRPAFEQLQELHKAVPRLGLVTIGNENSPYTTGTGYCKNCHLINCSEHCENCYYGKLLQNCRDCVDCSYTYDSELCYQCFSVHHCYDSRYLAYSYNCTQCLFSENLVGCTNCVFCANLQRQEYCVFNQKVSKDDYAKTVAAFSGSHTQFEQAKARWHKLRQERIHKYSNIVRSENCTGDFITNSKNCRDCYDVNDSEDCRYVCVGVNVKDMYDCSNVYLRQELNYQMLGTIADYHCAFSIYAFHSDNVLYSDHIYHSQNLFGCVGLKRKRFCVLNSEYSEQEYNVLVPRIIEHMKNTGEWGRFFPVSHSPYAYNETLAYDYFPLSKEEVLAKGWNWRDEDNKEPAAAAGSGIPDSIGETPDEILKQVLRCEASGMHYKIIPQELQFYRQHNIPIPRRAPLQRHRDRELLRNKRRVWRRTCAKCSKEIVSSFDSARPETLYCEECFLREVF